MPPANPLILRQVNNDPEVRRNFQRIDDNIGAANLGAFAHALIRLASNVANDETITVDNYVYQFKTAGQSSIGVTVDVSGGVTPALAAAAFAAAFNATPPAAGLGRQLRAVVVAANHVALIACGSAAAPLEPSSLFNGIALSETMAGANNTIETVTRSGQARSARQATIVRVPTQQEVDIGVVVVPLPFAPTSWNIRVITTSTGAVVAWDGAVTIVAAAGDLPPLAILNNAGAVDWATTSTLQMAFFG